MTIDTPLSQARDSLESGRDFAHAAMAGEIAGSWDRCRQMGLDPRGAPVDAAVSDQELAEHRAAREQLMSIVRPELELLSSQIAGTNFMCAFASETGVVLDAIMDSDFAASDCARSVRPGSIWREDLRGTNALGLALHSGRTSIVTGGEHFFACHGAVSCVSAPIFASDGSVAGLIDASSEVAERQVHTAALINLSATNIENRLFAEAHRADHILQFHPRAEYLPTQSVGMIAVDGAGRITGVNRASSRMLSGGGIAKGAGFDDVFCADFEDLLFRLLRGEVAQLSDWLNSGYFVRLRPAMPTGADRASGGARTQAALRKAPQMRNLTWDDEMVREALRVARRAASLGQPVCIRGATGTGKTAMAEAVHADLHPDAPLLVIDCKRLRREAGHLAPELLHRSGTVHRGTLILEDIASLNRQGADRLRRFLDSLPESDEDHPLCILATERRAPENAEPRVPVHAGLVFLAVDLPDLAARTDFDKIARGMLARISPDHRLSVKALKVLEEIPRPNNLTDLWQHLRVLAASYPARVLRDVQIARFFPPQDGEARACPKCETSPIRRQRCLEIRRTFRACQCNTALTARRLGVSRNTVYTHLKD